MTPRRIPLRTRILLATSALAVGLTAATLLLVRAQAEALVGARMTADLTRSQRLIARLNAERLARLELTASVVAQFAELPALLETDAVTLQDFLQQYLSDAIHVFLLLSPDRSLIARTDAVTPLGEPERRSVDRLFASRPPAGVITLADTVYLAATTPVAARGGLLGYLLAAARLDDQYARELRDIVQQEVVLLGESRVLGTTLRRETLPWRSMEDWRRGRPDEGEPPATVSIGGVAYEATGGIVVPGALAVVVLQSRNEALAPYRNIQRALLLLGGLAVLAGIAGSAWLARSITEPILTLTRATREVEAGRFDVRLDEGRSDELGELARSFNAMMEGLRQRADMQKFVSQSTVAMIEASRAPGQATAHRRTLTLLFSDIRGFTALAERLAPDAVVEHLNRALSVQADVVRRFEGDVDKFIGDAVFAHFSGRDSTLAAVRAGVEIHRELARLGEEAGAPGPLEVGIGIVHGEVLLGRIGSADRQDYTAVGPLVNLCARLANVAHGCEILLDEGAWQQVRDLVAVEPVELADVKGFSTPVRAWRMVVQVRPDAARPQRSV